MTLSVTNLSAGYGRVPVLRGINLAVAKGQIVGLLGGNGAGKTTLLRTLSGLATIQSGSIALFGANATRLPAGRLVEIGLVHVPQGRHLFRDMTVHENLEMGAYVVNDKAIAQARMERVLGLFPILRERSGQAAALLSGGEQQMLALGRAIMSEPRLLLLDEPSLGLAPKTFDLILDVVRDLNRGGTAILVAEQNTSKVLRLAHYSYVLENGRIIAEGESDALLADDRIRTSYLGAA
jgi:branched-chain amino acid transport system ATP-binding protein